MNVFQITFCIYIYSKSFKLFIVDADFILLNWSWSYLSMRLHCLGDRNCRWLPYTTGEGGCPHKEVPCAHHEQQTRVAPATLIQSAERNFEWLSCLKRGRGGVVEISWGCMACVKPPTMNIIWNKQAGAELCQAYFQLGWLLIVT